MICEWAMRCARISALSPVGWGVLVLMLVWEKGKGTGEAAAKAKELRNMCCREGTEESDAGDGSEDDDSRSGHVSSCPA